MCNQMFFQEILYEDSLKNKENGGYTVLPPTIAPTGIASRSGGHLHFIVDKAIQTN